MGAVEAVVTIVTAIMWPAVVLIVLFVLRKQLPYLVQRMSRFSAAGVEAEFGEQVAAASELAEVAVPDPPGDLPSSTNLVPQPSLSDLLSEAERHPIGAMVRAWNLVDGAIEANGRVPVKGASPRFKIRMMRRNGVVKDDIFALYNRLESLRNQVVHGVTIPSEAEAKEFVVAAFRLASSIYVSAQDTSGDVPQMEA